MQDRGVSFGLSNNIPEVSEQVLEPLDVRWIIETGIQWLDSRPIATEIVDFVIFDNHRLAIPNQTNPRRSRGRCPGQADRPGNVPQVECQEGSILGLELLRTSQSRDTASQPSWRPRTEMVREVDGVRPVIVENPSTSDARIAPPVCSPFADSDRRTRAKDAHAALLEPTQHP